MLRSRSLPPEGGTTNKRLVRQPQTELPLAHCGELEDVGDATRRARTIHADVRVGQVDFVRRIEGFGAKLRFEAFGDAERFGH